MYHLILSYFKKIFAPAPHVKSGFDFDADMNIDTERIDNFNIFRRLYLKFRHFSIYQATPVKHLDLLVDIVRASGLEIFCDIGSGKGRMIILMAPYFKKIIGVEYFRSLHDVAVMNINNHQLHNVELMNMDAADFLIPEEPSIIYLYNPFGVEILSRFIKNNRSRFSENHIIIYVNAWHRDVLKAEGFSMESTSEPEVKLFRRKIK